MSSARTHQGRSCARARVAVYNNACARERERGKVAAGVVVAPTRAMPA